TTVPRVLTARERARAVRGDTHHCWTHPGPRGFRAPGHRRSVDLQHAVPHPNSATAPSPFSSPPLPPCGLSLVCAYLDGDIDFQVLQQECEEKPRMGLRTSGRAIPEGGHMENVDPAWSTALWQQFGAAIDMFDNAVVVCPDSLWRERLWSAPPDDPQSPWGEV